MASIEVSMDRMLSSVVAGIPVPALVIDQNERITCANARGLKLFGPTIMGRHYVVAMRQPALLAAIETALRNGENSSPRLVIANSAREVVFQVTVSALEGGHAMCVFEDVTEQEHTSAIRRDFVANVSHELRTPLTSLLGFIETLQGAAKDDPVARGRFLVIMSREAERMNRLVRDLLSLSRVESEERMRPTVACDLVALVGMAATALRPTARNAGVDLEITGDAGPLMVPADPDQMVQVFQNLIENAIKYGASGGLVTIDMRKDDSDTLRLGRTIAVRVIDRGDGVDAIHIPRLTERFYRVDNHRSREMGGTGLGLAIVKHIVNRHRGRMRIESIKGEGTTFTVLLPQA